MRRATISSESRRVLEEVAGHYGVIRGFRAVGVHVTDSTQGWGGKLMGQKTVSPLEFCYRAPNLFYVSHGDQEMEGVGRGKRMAPHLMEYGCTGTKVYSQRRGVGCHWFEVNGKLKMGDSRARQELHRLAWNLPVLFAMADDPVGVILSEARAVGAQSDAQSGETRIVVEGRLPYLFRAELVLDGVLGLVWFEHRMDMKAAKRVMRDEFSLFEVGELAEERFGWRPPEGAVGIGG